MRIVSLEISNVKRLSAVRIVPKSSTVVLAGKNGAGKTSCLDAIEMVLAGGKTIPPEPMRRGARKGYIVADLGELVVERTFSAKGSSLTVRNKDGVAQSSPQEILNGLVGKVCLDPLVFARALPRDQDKILKELVGLDFSKDDAERQVQYDERTRLKRKLRDDEALYNAMPEHPSVGDKEIDVAAVVAERDAMREHNHNLQQATQAVERQEAELQRIDAHIAQLEAQLKAAREKHATETGALNDLRSKLFALGEPKDTAELDTKIQSAAETNAKVRANQARDAAAKKLRDLEVQIDKATAAIDAIDARKAAKLAAVEFPVPGLGFDESGPLLNGVPLEQASQAEKVKLSCAIGLKMNPALKVVIIREGVFLDDDSMAFLEELAEKHDAQVWIELVKTDNPSAIIIEDGAVKEAATAAE